MDHRNKIGNGVVVFGDPLDDRQVLSAVANTGERGWIDSAVDELLFRSPIHPLDRTLHFLVCLTLFLGRSCRFSRPTHSSSFIDLKQLKLTQKHVSFIKNMRSYQTMQNGTKRFINEVNLFKRAGSNDHNHAK